MILQDGLVENMIYVRPTKLISYEQKLYLTWPKAKFY